MKNIGRSTKDFKNKCKYIIMALEPKQQLALNIFELSANDLPDNLMDDLLRGMDNLLFLYELLFSNKYKNFREEIGVSNIKTLIDKAVFIKFAVDKIKEMPSKDYKLLRLYFFKNRKMSEIAKKLSMTKDEAYARYDILIESIKRGAFDLLETRCSKTEKFKPYPLTNLYSRSYLDILLAIAKLSDKEIEDLYAYFENRIENPGLVTLNIDLQCRYSSKIMPKLSEILKTINTTKSKDCDDNKTSIIEFLSKRERDIAKDYYASNILGEHTQQVIDKIDFIESIVINKYPRLKELFPTMFIGTKNEVIKNVALLSEIIGTFDKWQVDIFKSYFIEGLSVLKISLYFEYSVDVIEKILGDMISYVQVVLPLLLDNKSSGYTIESIYKTLNAYSSENVLNAILELDSFYRKIIFEVHGFNLEEPNPVDIEKVPYTTYVECILPTLRGILERNTSKDFVNGEYFVPNKPSPYMIKSINGRKDTKEEN